MKSIILITLILSASSFSGEIIKNINPNHSCESQCKFVFDDAFDENGKEFDGEVNQLIRAVGFTKDLCHSALEKQCSELMEQFDSVYHPDHASRTR